MSHKFPLGTARLKVFSVNDSSRTNILRPPDIVKGQSIALLMMVDIVLSLRVTLLTALFLKDFPWRRFILIGDSGEKDPQLYGSICRRFPDQVLRVFIRDVTTPSIKAKYAALAVKKGGVGLESLVKQRDSELLQFSVRMKTAFSNVDREKWSLFTKPEDLLTCDIVNMYIN